MPRAFQSLSPGIRVAIGQNRPLKIVKVRRGLEEDPDAARERHFAAHPEDRGANIVIFEFYDDEETADESPDCASPAGLP